MARESDIPPMSAESGKSRHLPGNPVQLAIETTGTSGSIAILCSKEVLNHTRLPTDLRTASSLAPAVDQALKWCREKNLNLDFVSIATGPGSFTGLRIGVTTAKTLCYATKLPLVAVDSAAAIAATVFASANEIDDVTVGINAFRRQVFTGQFRRNELLGQARSDESKVSVVDEPEWNSILHSIVKNNMWYAGDAKVFKSIESARSDAGGSEGGKFAERELPDAVGVGLLGLRKARHNQWCDPISLVPQYIKKSAAEENLA